MRPSRFLPLLVALFLLLLVALVAAQSARPVRTPEGVLLPDLAVTPGVINPRLTTAVLCSQTFRTRDERKVTPATRRRVCALYGVTPCDGRVEVDHLISLELGGANDVQNLWPQPYEPKPGARQKDVVENWLHREVCAGRVSLAEAQRRIATDWYAVYQDYLAQRTPRH